MTDRSNKKPRLKQTVCKPCWELKYCPYGVMVEYYPGDPAGLKPGQIEEIHEKALRWIREAESDDQMYEALAMFMYSDPAQTAWLSQYECDELRCLVFGHICPVYFLAEMHTETKAARATGRHIARDVMLKVVRRDGQICQNCHQPVPDQEVEFDHVIPVARGGASSTENLRLTCRSCNRKKRDSLADVIHDRFRQH